MLVDTNNLVTTEQFRRDLDKYVTAARQGGGPVAVMQDTKVVGVFINPDEYEAMCGEAVQRLLTARAKGPKITHEQTRERLDKVIARRRAPRGS